MKSQTPQQFLQFLNDTYAHLHKKYEDYFWLSYMGDHSVDQKMTKAMAERDAFRANREYSAKINEFLGQANPQKLIQRLRDWQLFFSKYQTPPELLDLRNKIQELETKIREKRSSREEGYIDPHTKKFVQASEIKMRLMRRSDPDQKIRKACHEGCEALAYIAIDEYIELVGMLNHYAKTLGYPDFYSYKVLMEEGLTKAELFAIFGEIYDKTKYAFKDVRDMEKKMPGLRKPWNFGFMLSGDFAKEEDPYFDFDNCLELWGRSFAALGIDYKGGRLRLDLLDRPGKWNNGFCHWPDLVQYKNGRRIPGSSNFTTNAVYGQVGSGIIAMNTLFHEGGHAAHLLNSTQTEVIMNTEYPPASTAWDETQSMFLDTLFSSIEWKMRYAKNAAGQPYPYDLFKRKVERLNKLSPLDMNGIMYVMYFEKEIYEAKNLDREKVLQIAKKVHRKFLDMSEDSVGILNVPHIYSWESICAYHGYGLAELALNQWRRYFYKKYGYIVDNKKVGREMAKVWRLGSSKTFAQCVKLATGQKLSAKAYIDNVTRKKKQVFKLAEQRIARLAKVPMQKGKINLNAKIEIVNGREIIANNSSSFEEMSAKFKKWLAKNYG